MNKHVIGIDLAGPTNAADTVAICVEIGEKTKPKYVDHQIGILDDAILAFVEQYWPDQLSDPSGRLIVGLDAPLSYALGGGSRPADTAMRQTAIAAGLPAGTVMAPTFTKMAYLTLRGLAVSRLLENLARQKGSSQKQPMLEIIEVHPTTALALRKAPIESLREMKRQDAARLEVFHWLKQTQIRGLPEAMSEADHCIAACGAALAAVGYARGAAKVEHAAELPFHPYPFVA